MPPIVTAAVSWKSCWGQGEVRDRDRALGPLGAPQPSSETDSSNEVKPLLDVAKPYESIGFGAMDVTKPCEFIRFGGQKPSARTKCINKNKKMKSSALFALFGPEIADFVFGGYRQLPISGRCLARPGPGGAWERPRPGPRSMCTDFQPGRPTLRPFREFFFEPLVIAWERRTRSPCLLLGRGVPGPGLTRVPLFFPFVRVGPRMADFFFGV